MWTILLETAGGAFSRAFAANLGEQIGAAAERAFAKALFGDSDAVFQQEVVTRLDRIERKIDAIMSFLNEQLPRLIYQQTESAILRQTVNTITASRVAVVSALVAYRAHPNRINADKLKDSAEDIAKLGFSISLNGPIWYGGALEAFASCVMGYGVLIRESDNYANQYGPSLKLWARQYGALFQEWLDPTNPVRPKSIVAVKQSELVTANMIVAQTPIGNYLLAIYSSEAVNAGVEVNFYGMKAWSERVGGGTWGGDWGGAEQRAITFKANVNPDPQAWKASYGWKVLDFLPLPICYTPSYPGPISKQQMWDQFNAVNAAINDAQWKHDYWPKQIEELSRLIAVCTEALNAANAIG